MYDASNKKDIRAKEKLDKALDAQRIDFIVGAMSIPAGRAWFYQFLESCNLFMEVPTYDPMKEMYKLGARNIGLAIFADLHAHCPDHYITMMKEANARRISHDNLNPVRPGPAPEFDGGADDGRDDQGPELDADLAVDDIYGDPR